jgi:uncharacterized membrane protein YGL010W
MKSLGDQIAGYGAYHHDWRNKLTHFVGVPLVTFSLFLFLSWFRFVHNPEIPLTAATLFYLVVFFYYVILDWRIALLQAPFTLALLWLADRSALWPLTDSFLFFLGTFVGGWIIQLLGHAFEGRRPALADNILQIFNAPLFLVAEILFAFRLRADLRKAHPSAGNSPALAASGGGQ